jgi:hypothetical protein
MDFLAWQLEQNEGKFRLKMTCNQQMYGQFNAMQYFHVHMIGSSRSGSKYRPLGGNWTGPVDNTTKHARPGRPKNPYMVKIHRGEAEGEGSTDLDPDGYGQWPTSTWSTKSGDANCVDKSI